MRIYLIYSTIGRHQPYGAGTVPVRWRRHVQYVARSKIQINIVSILLLLFLLLLVPVAPTSLASAS